MLSGLGEVAPQLATAVQKLKVKVSQHADFQNFAAVTIQRFWRGYRARAWYREQVAAIRQSEVLEEQELKDWDFQVAAVTLIQTAWRGYSDRRIYVYYRDLIRLKERTDPKQLLRCINPREADLVDAAAGLHVRFRLGGTMFPPLIFYKIFTHRPVTDICAFCPRFYASETTSTPTHNHSSSAASSASTSRGSSSQQARHHREDSFNLDTALREYIKPDGTIGYRSTVGWYERFENNGWRPVADRVLVEEDPVTTLTGLRRIPFFHHVPAVRREDRIRKLKNNKRDWMMKLYTSGLVGAGTCRTQESVEDEQEGAEAEALQGDDDQSLVEWSNHLDFDCYLDSWRYLACTMGSEAFVPELESAYLPEMPTVSLNVHEAIAGKGLPPAMFKGSATAAGGIPVSYS